MRDICIIIAIVIIIIAGDIVMQKYLNKTADEVLGKLNELKQETIIAKETENREAIKKIMKNVETEWNKTHEIWASIVMHQELDNIEQALIRAKSNIEHGKLTDALEEIETTIFFVEHVKEREKLSLKNIF